MDNEMEAELLEAEPSSSNNNNGGYEEQTKKLSRKVWEETKIISRISLPSMVYRVMTSGVLLVTQSFIGHISSVELAAYAIVQSISLRFINGILVSLPSSSSFLSGVAIGCGSQAKVAIVNLVSYYVVGIPIGCVLAFVFTLGVKVHELKPYVEIYNCTQLVSFITVILHCVVIDVEQGIWIGMLTGMVAQVLVLVIVTWRINWDDEVCCVM
ncbi:hypothetical protein V2J09_012968 [Rumex salicifolius]